MDEANCRCFWIDNVNRTAIGHMNTKCDLFLTRDDSVATGEFFVARDGLIDDRDFVAVNLLGGEKRPFRHSDLISHFTMNSIEALQCLRFVMGNIDSGNSLDESVTTKFDRLKRWKIFDRNPRDHQKSPRPFYFELGRGEIAVTGPG